MSLCSLHLPKVFELLTGMALFRAQSEEGITKEEVQLKMMVNLLGEIPREMLSQGNHTGKYFNQGNAAEALVDIPGRFRSDPELVPKESSIRRVLEILKEKSKRYIDLSAEEILVVDDLLCRMWTISPSQRETAETLLQHSWFHGLEG
jgi:hypothetical protein